MSRHNKDLGDLGEKYAIKHLKRRRYKVLDTNYTTRIGEIDIIAEKGEYIVFVEVKTRVDCEFGRPSEAVTPAKQQKIMKMASAYILNYPDKTARFDIVEILGVTAFGKIKNVFGGRLVVKEINHIENAFWG